MMMVCFAILNKMTIFTLISKTRIKVKTNIWKRQILVQV